MTRLYRLYFELVFSLQHNRHYVFKAQAAYFPCTLGAHILCWNNIDSRCVNAAVTENVGKLGDVIFQIVKCSCEQMAKIVREHLIGINMSQLT